MYCIYFFQFWGCIRDFSIDHKTKIDERKLKIIIEDILAILASLQKLISLRISSLKDVINIFLKQVCVGSCKNFVKKTSRGYLVRYLQEKF